MEFHSKIIMIDKMTAYGNLDNFSDLFLRVVYACVTIVHTRADQFLPQLIMEQSYTLPPHYRHTGHLHEEV